MKKIIISFFIISCCWITSSVINLAEAGSPVLIARVSEWPPGYWEEDGKWVGMNIDFYKALAKQADIRFEFKHLTWSRALSSMKNGYCNIMAELSRTPEREAYMHFLGPYNLEEMVLVVNQEDKHVVIQNLDQMTLAARKRGLRIGIEKDSFYSDEVNYRLENDAEFRENFYFAKLTLNIMVLRNRIFGFFDQSHVVSYKLKTDPEYKGLAIHPFKISSGPLYFGVSRATPAELVESLSTACDTLMKDGTFKTIRENWSHVD